MVFAADISHVQVADDVLHVAGEVIAQRSPGVVLVTTVGTEAAVPRTAQMFLAVVESFADRMSGVSLEAALGEIVV